MYFVFVSRTVKHAYRNQNYNIEKKNREKNKQRPVVASFFKQSKSSLEIHKSVNVASFFCSKIFQIGNSGKKQTFRKVTNKIYIYSNYIEMMHRFRLEREIKNHIYQSTSDCALYLICLLQHFVCSKSLFINGL